MLLKVCMQNRRLQRVYIEREHGRSVAAVLVPHRSRMLAPVALRPVVSAYGRRRSLIDRLLLYGEWAAAMVLVAFASYQIFDGPVRDWLHEPEVTALAAPPQPVAALQPMALREQVVEVPLVVADAAQPQIADDVAQPQIPDDVAASTRMLHPELGYALPGIGEKWRRPAVAPDYLQPARDFVPAAAVPPAVPPPAIVEAAPPAPAADPRPTRVFAPATGIDTSTQEVFLVDGVWQVADYAAGYLNGTGVPGSGNVVMAGHQGIRGAVFAGLPAVKPGDDVFVDTVTQRYRYRVRETGTVWPSQVSVMFPSATPTLTLLTCINWDMQRLVVIADLVDSVALPASAS